MTTALHARDGGRVQLSLYLSQLIEMAKWQLVLQVISVYSRKTNTPVQIFPYPEALLSLLKKEGKKERKLNPFAQRLGSCKSPHAATSASHEPSARVNAVPAPRGPASSRRMAAPRSRSHASRGGSDLPPSPPLFLPPVEVRVVPRSCLPLEVPLPAALPAPTPPAVPGTLPERGCPCSCPARSWGLRRAPSRAAELPGLRAVLPPRERCVSGAGGGSAGAPAGQWPESASGRGMSRKVTAAAGAQCALPGHCAMRGAAASPLGAVCLRWEPAELLLSRRLSRVRVPQLPSDFLICASLLPAADSHGGCVSVGLLPLPTAPGWAGRCCRHCAVSTSFSSPFVAACGC